MDAYSMCRTSKRSSSKIYQDLWASRLHSLADLGTGSLRPGMAIKEGATQFSNAHPPHVAVVGAGVSGLRCADILLQCGFKVTVIEGRDRVGGRLHQEQLPNGHLVDVGPNWIHGTKDNPIYDLARKTGTVAGNWDNESYVYNEDGDLFPIPEGGQYSELMWDIIQAAFKHSDKYAAAIDPKESLLDFFKKQVKQRIPVSDPDHPRKRGIVLQLAKAWGAFIGTDISRQSLKFFWLEECIEGENLLCAGTYKKILDEIAKPALAGTDMKFNTKITRISYRNSDNDRVSLATDSGATLTFDEVVVTSPLGWLKQNTGAFDPPLPPRMIKAIHSIQYGCLEKVYITFPKAFWLTPDSKGRKVSGFAQWLSPSYAPESNPSRWNQEVVELAGVDPSVAHPTLLFYAYGDQSKHITSHLRELPTQAKRDAFILDFFGPYYSRLPNYSTANPDCTPCGCLATSWLTDDLAGNGSYCNFQVGLEEGDKDIRTMREGLPNHGLWLAGEHTAPFVGLGTATGAYWSGEAVGKRIGEAYGRQVGGSGV